MRFLAGLIIAILVSCGPAMAQTTLSTGNAKKLQGRSVSSTAPTDEQCLIYDTGTSQWRPSNCAASGALTLTGMTGNVSPAVCGRAYIATACGFTLTLPTTPAADCQIGIGVSCVGGTTVVPGGADTISGGTTEPTIQISRNQVQVFQYAATGATWIQHAAPGVMVYEATGTYAMGDVVTDDGTTPTKYCRSRVNANTGNALTSTTHWACFASPDGTTLEFNAGVLRVKASGIGSNEIANNSVAIADLAPDYRFYGQTTFQSISSCSLFSTGILGPTATGTTTPTLIDDGGRYCSYASAASADADAGWTSAGTNTEEGLAPILEVRVYVVDVTSIEHFVGWFQQGAAADLPLGAAINGIGFAFDDSADTAFWQCVSNDGAASITKTDSTVALTTNTFYNLRIDWTTAATPLFYINGAQVCASHTTDLPSDTQDLSLRAIAETEDGTAKTFGISGAEAWSY